jgi:hypothetical protein
MVSMVLWKHYDTFVFIDEFLEELLGSQLNTCDTFAQDKTVKPVEERVAEERLFKHSRC